MWASASALTRTVCDVRWIWTARSWARKALGLTLRLSDDLNEPQPYHYYYNALLTMQNYYLHHTCLHGLTPKLMRPYRTPDGPLVAAVNHSNIELYRLLQHDLTFHVRHSFHARIERLEVLPSLFHKHDYLWILDSKGRFCCWHPIRTDLACNTVLWD